VDDIITSLLSKNHTQNCGTSCSNGCSLPKSSVLASSSCSRPWVTVSRRSSRDTSGDSPRTCQITLSAPSGLAGYPTTSKPLSYAIPKFRWTLRPTMQTVSRRPSPGLRSLALATQLTTPSW
jgi:hypothetical protein